jgi:hypothetical protein
MDEIEVYNMSDSGHLGLSWAGHVGGVPAKSGVNYSDPRSPHIDSKDGSSSTA